MNKKWQKNWYDIAKSIVKSGSEYKINKKTTPYVEKQLIGLSETLIALYEEKTDNGFTDEVDKNDE